jgi:hypothetical protein
VLRITFPTRDDPPVFILEGRLAGLWVKELLRVTHDIGPNTNCVFDIEDVLYVDQLGEQTLGWLNRLGATFIAENAYGKDLCERLHLRRRAAANEMNERRKRRTVQSSPDSSPPSSRARPPPKDSMLKARLAGEESADSLERL